MVDLETMGTRPGCAIVAIGAVSFTTDGIASEFYQQVDLESCQRAGMHLDGGTVKWWLTQDEKVRQAVTGPGIDVYSALLQFRAWLAQGGGEPCVWGDGAAFDNAILHEAFRLCKLGIPWSYTHDRCYRTVRGLFPSVKWARKGTCHHALDDARDQALHLLEIFKKLNGQASS